MKLKGIKQNSNERPGIMEKGASYAKCSVQCKNCKVHFSVEFASYRSSLARVSTILNKMFSSALAR